ncbi:TonB-dependent receptor [uncultured Zhongshania sp.]|uniref:TonB-dependent receptor n=1 Tax=uncultured Zhongshania sp. TaxID=1642288 RepID=UPI0025D36F75|nr:TonB-dependent receptor [uncultured Zhongshania sp.]
MSNFSRLAACFTPRSRSLVLLALVALTASMAEADKKKSGSKMEEILVTASFREQDVQDVVGGIQVFGGEQLDKNGVSSMEDYLRDVPSVSLQKSGVGKANIAIRGISNMNTLDIGYADGSPIAGVYFNDVAIQGSGVFPDLNIFDLQRVEVLKGPQGTLYGEGSMGGAIKMIMMPPNMQELEFKVATTVSETAEASDLNWDVRGAINIPIIQDKLAARIVASSGFDSGFVTYSELGLEDPDDENRHSLRAIVLFKPLDWLELEYMYLLDYSNRDQLPVVDEGREDDLVNSRIENQFAETEFDVHSLTARMDLGFAGLTSVSSWFNTNRDSQRRIPILQGIVDVTVSDNSGGAVATGPSVFPNGYTHVLTELESFSQEFRLVSKGDERIDWVVGAFYRDRVQKFDQEKYEEFAPDDPLGLLELLLGPDFLALSGLQEDGYGEEPFKQTAVYGEVSWEIIEAKLELTAGLRWFEDSVAFFQDTYVYGVEAILFATDPENVDPETGEVNIFFAGELTTRDWLPKLSLAWYVNDDAMVYATVSKGFRSGTPNLFAVLDAGPPNVRPDFVLNQEIGAKTAWLDNRLIANFGIYQIDWDDFQGLVIGEARLGAVGGVPFGYLGTGGDAVVRGAELSVMYKPVDSLTLTLGVGYNSGEVVKPEPANNAKKGSELPNKPELTWNLGVNYTRPLWSDLLAEVSLGYTFVDSQLTVFQTEDVPTGIPLDSYEITKAAIGIEGMNWRAQLFAQNLFDDRIVVARSLPFPQSAMMRPRTLGMRFSYDY